MVTPEASQGTTERKGKMNPHRFQELLQAEAPHLAEKNGQYFSLLGERWLARIPDQQKAELWKQWGQEFNALKLRSRHRRAEDLGKKDAEGQGIVDQAREKARRVIGEKHHHYFVTCIDGRNLPTIMMSHVPHFGGAIRTQAGELFGFRESIGGKNVVLDQESFEATLIIKELLEGKPGETIFYSLDSHIGCAARGQLHQGSGGLETDNGLLMDIERKLRIAQGITDYAETLGKTKKVANIIPQLFSYDPHDGTLHMGLEIHVDAVQDTGFTDEVLASLSAESKIVKTRDFLSNPEITKYLEEAVVATDFRNQFAESLLSNWTAIETLYDNGNGPVYQTIRAALIQAYKNGGFEIGNEDNLAEKQISYLALENKSKVMLKNLVTRWSIAKDADEHHWPFAKHLEQGVVITDGGYGPFQPQESDIPPDVFAVFSKEDPAFRLGHIKLGVSLIRNFRRAGSIQDPTGMLEGADFAEAPVPVFNHAVLRNIAPETWQQLNAIDFMSVFSQIDWDDPIIKTWTVKNIQDMLQGALKDVTFSFGESSALVEGFWELFESVRHLMDDPEFRTWIVSGRVLLVNKLIDHDRQPQVFAPMVF